MSADNPTRGSSDNDKPVPVKPALPADGGAAPRQRRVTMSQAEYGRYVTSRPPIRRMETDTPGSPAPQSDHRGGPGTHTTASEDDDVEGVPDRNRGRRAGAPDDAESSPDVSDSGDGETVRESAPDQQPDGPRWAAMEQRFQAFEEREAKRQAEVDALKAENSELRKQLDAQQAEINDLKAKGAQRDTSIEADRLAECRMPPGSSRPPELAEPDEPRDVLERGEGVGDQADVDVIDKRVQGESVRNAEPTADERPGSDLAKAGKDGLGLAGALAVTNPVVQMVVAGDAVHRTYKDLSPEDKYQAHEVLGAYVAASGAMSPGMALAATTVSAAMPRLLGGLQNVIDKIRRKDRDEPGLENLRGN